MGALTKHAKFDAVVDRLVTKIKASQVPVPGFMMSISGTDSLIAFRAVYAACIKIEAETGRRIPVEGIHYAKSGRHKPGLFEAEGVQWLRRQCPQATIIVKTPLGGNQDQQRWADLHVRALHKIVVDDQNRVTLSPREPGETFWIAGTINASEWALGKYSMLANAVSIQPIRSLWKSEIMALCAMMGVPERIIDAARIPDCLCGRDEIAAENIELIDAILRDTYDPTQHDPALLKTLISYIRQEKQTNSFKQRTPFVV